jgi:hypothetical protein
MRHYITAIALAAAMAGCAQMAAIETVAVDKVSQANDAARDAAHLVLCRGITVGSWVRAYGTQPELAAAWRTLCGTPITELPAVPK